MHVSVAEYNELNARFHCTSVCDEQYLAPFEVDARGGGTWTAYVEGNRFHNACDWLKGWRLRGMPNDAPAVVTKRETLYP
jgi:hypothetical protein